MKVKATAEICIAKYVINRNKNFNKIPFGELINKIYCECETGI